MLETILVAAAVVTVIVGSLQVYQFAKTRRDRRLHDGSDRAIQDKWVNLNYAEGSGIGSDLRSKGYQLRWVAATRETELVDLRGWEYVERVDGQGLRWRFKVKDDSVGGYLILLKRRTG